MTGYDLKIPLCGLYENTSQRTGKTYFVGYLGRAKLVMLQTPDAAEGEPGWTLFLAERPERNAPGTAPAAATRPPTSAPPRRSPRRQPARPLSPAACPTGDPARPFDDDLPDFLK